MRHICEMMSARHPKQSLKCILNWDTLTFCQLGVKLVRPSTFFKNLILIFLKLIKPCSMLNILTCYILIDKTKKNVSILHFLPSLCIFVMFHIKDFVSDIYE